MVCHSPCFPRVRKATGVTHVTCIDATHCGSCARFINHSCEPNLAVILCRIDSVVPHVAFFARRDIAPGEELTIDYGEGSPEDARALQSTESKKRRRAQHTEGCAQGKRSMHEGETVTKRHRSGAGAGAGTGAGAGGVGVGVDADGADGGAGAGAGASAGADARDCCTSDDAGAGPRVRMNSSNCVPSIGGRHLARSVVCLCGSKHCRGFLPFDPV